MGGGGCLGWVAVQGRDVLSRAGNGPSAWATHRAQVTELFRDVYRKTWSAPDVAGVLASVREAVSRTQRQGPDTWRAGRVEGSDSS